MKELKSKRLGHNLRALLAEAYRRGLELEVKLEPIEIGVIGLLSYEYLRKRYQYSRKELGKTISVPLPAVTERAADKLVRGLRDYCAKY